MPDFDIDQYFSGVRMTELFRSEAVKRGIPDPLEEYASVSPNSPVGPAVQWEEVIGTRKTAPLVNFGSPSQTVDVEGVQRRFATAVTAKQDFVIGQQTLLALKNNIPLMAEAAKRELVNKVSNFRTRMDNTAKAVRHSALAQGAVFADSNGNILPNSTGASLSVAFNIPTENQLTKNGSGGTYTVGDWSNPATDIPKLLRNLRKANTDKNGHRLTTIHYGVDVPSFIFANTAVQEYLKRNPLMNQKVLDTNEIPDGLLGWKWRPVSEAIYDDFNGVTRSWFANNFVSAAPDVSTNWWEYFECGSLVPRGIAVPNTSLEAALENFDIAYGLFSYCEMGTNPVAVKNIMGWSGLGVIKVPGVYYFGACS